jgi:hypothetical protein
MCEKGNLDAALQIVQKWLNAVNLLRKIVDMKYVHGLLDGRRLQLQGSGKA